MQEKASMLRRVRSDAEDSASESALHHVATAPAYLSRGPAFLMGVDKCVRLIPPHAVAQR
jgi:hypothetical protein